jgi:hypothetical protein
MRFFDPYDVLYKSKVFDFSAEPNIQLYANEIHQGGCAYDLQNRLPDEVEHMMPDYSLYNVKNTAYGFLTRGCPRGCSFCNVQEHQGKQSLKVADLSEFWDGQKEIKLLDPNITACRHWEELFYQLIDSKAKIDFTQGIDIRTMTEEKQQMLNQMNLKMLHFAWDNYEMNTYEKLKQFRKNFKLIGRNLTVYVLTNYNTTTEQDLERLYKLRELDYTPYVMIYDKIHADTIHKRMARWVNNRFIWHPCKRFEDYMSA